MAGNRYRAFSILGAIAWLTAACTGTPAPEPAAPTPRTIYFGLSDADIAAAERAIQEALETLPSNQPLLWYGTRTSGLVKPFRTFKIKTGHFCRDFTESVHREASPLLRTSRACRTDEGRWLRVPLAQPQPQE